MISWLSIIISYVRVSSICISDVISKDEYDVGGILGNLGLGRVATARLALFAILFREKAQVFLLLNARTDVAAWANDDSTLVCGIKDDEERAEHCSWRIYSTLARVRAYLIHKSVLVTLDSNFEGALSHALCLLVEYTPIYLHIFLWLLKNECLLLINT